ncbi:MAG: hypothetical protein KC636_13175 [Myxococcales bacterium]|nr:hypothetical protein [Myxococcales bacterium]
MRACIVSTVLFFFGCSGGAAPQEGAPAEAKVEAKAEAKAAPPAEEGGAKMILSKADAEDILGLSVEVGDRGEGYSYTSKDPLGTVTVDVIDAAPLRMLQGGKPVIEGLGDLAFYQMKTPQSVILHVIQGDRGVTISVSFVRDGAAKIKDLGETAEEVARRALPNL